MTKKVCLSAMQEPGIQWVTITKSMLTSYLQIYPLCRSWWQTIQEQFDRIAYQTACLVRKIWRKKRVFWLSSKTAIQCWSSTPVWQSRSEFSLNPHLCWFSADRQKREQNAKETAEIPKQSIISEYNQHMAGGDKLDSSLAKYRFRLRSRRW